MYHPSLNLPQYGGFYTPTVPQASYHQTPFTPVYQATSPYAMLPQTPGKRSCLRKETTSFCVVTGSSVML